MRATMWSDRPALAQVAEPALAQLYQIWVRLEAADAAAATAAAEALAPGAPLLVVLEALPRALLLCPAACVCRAWRAAVAIII